MACRLMIRLLYILRVLGWDGPLRWTWAVACWRGSDETVYLFLHLEASFGYACFGGDRPPNPVSRGPTSTLGWYPLLDKKLHLAVRISEWTAVQSTSTQGGEKNLHPWRGTVGRSGVLALGVFLACHQGCCTCTCCQ